MTIVKRETLLLKNSGIHHKQDTSTKFKKSFGMILAPTNNINTSQSQYTENMMSAEDYFKTDRSKMDNIYSMSTNNNNNNILHSEQNTPLLHHDMAELKPMNGGSLDEQRALQLALELSMLGLTADDDSLSYNELRMKKSMNMTECVPVPSSEHVAEIVGRQGCKIKALRAKTNTYIKTPVRGEEPVFVVTGRKEDVALAKREILQAAEHFSQIRASRRNSTSLSPLGSPSPTAPGHITKQVRVPYRVVGLVVGPKGSTIKRIQQATNTYIVTPSRDKEPVFEVTGLPDNVDRAKREVEQHIALRTGGIIDPTHPESNDHLLNGFSSSLFSPSGSSSTGSFSALLDHGHSDFNGQRSHSMDSYSYLSGGSSKYSDLNSATTSPFTNNAFFYDTMIPSPTTEVENSMGQFDPAPGSPWPDMLQPRNPITNRAPGMPAQSRSLSVNAYSSSENSGRSSPAQLRRLLSETSADAYSGLPSSYSHFNGTTTTHSVMSPTVPETTSIIDMGKVATSDGESQSSSPDWLTNTKKQNLINLATTKKQCYVCQSNKVVAALVPCGHNLFCMECAEQVKEADGECPACQTRIEAVLRIFS